MLHGCDPRVITSLSPLLVMWLSHFSALREVRGAKWCRRKGFGPLRRYLDERADLPPLAGFVSKGVGWSTADTLPRARDLAKLHCRLCGKCELGKD